MDVSVKSAAHASGCRHSKRKVPSNLPALPAARAYKISYGYWSMPATSALRRIRKRALCLPHPEGKEN
eukprot:5764635-Pleurochrysis_carterae.AAC.2